MGLGKTLSCIALVHTLLTNAETNVKRVIILSPVNALLNWIKEFQVWLEQCRDGIAIYDIINDTTPKSRLKTISQWHKMGGVLVTGYQMFVNLVQGKSKKIKNAPYTDEFRNYLLNPGCDLIICDEGHVLKNNKTHLNKWISQIKTRKRIVLTGSPLQNNLKEYYCMVTFVKPGLLGKKKIFQFNLCLSGFTGFYFLTFNRYRKRI